MFHAIRILILLASLSAMAQAPIALAAAVDPCSDSRAEDAAKQAKSELERSDAFAARPEVTGVSVNTCKTYFFEDALGLASPFDVRTDVCGVRVSVQSKAGIKSFGQWLKKENGGSFFLGKGKNVSVCADVTGSIQPQ